MFKKILAAGLALILSIPALGGPSPIIWDASCVSGAYNLASNACLGSSSATVSSVGLSDNSSFITVSGSPVTTSGTLVDTWLSQAPNLVLAGPTGTPAAVPSFRALTTYDLPSSTLSFLDTSATNGGLSESGQTLYATQASASTNGWVSSSQVVQWNTTIANQLSTATNTSGGTITLGQVVYITGYSGGQPTIALAEANSPSTMPGWGVMAQSSCANNATCNVQTQGFLTMNTTGLTVGQAAYVSPTTAGGLVATQPAFSTTTAPLLQSVGLVDSVGSSGQIYVVLQQPDGIQGGSRSSSWLLGPGSGSTITMGVNNGFSEVFSMDPTANRTITVPDATDTLAELGQSQTFTGANTFQPASSSNTPVLVKGASGQSVDILDVENSSSSVLLKVTSGNNVAVTNTLTNTGQFSNTYNGAASTAAINVAPTTMYAAGTGTTNFPLVFLQPNAPTAASTWSTSGTVFGINSGSSTANLEDLRVNGTSEFSISPAGAVVIAGAVTGGAYNKVTVTAPASSATLTIANGKTLTYNNSIAISGTDSTTMTFPSVTSNIASIVTPTVATCTTAESPACTAGAPVTFYRYTGTSSDTCTIANPTGCADGQRIVFELIQPSSGASATWAWGTDYKNTSSYTQTTTNALEDQLGCIWNNTTSHCNLIVGGTGLTE